MKSKGVKGDTYQSNQGKQYKRMDCVLNVSSSGTQKIAKIKTAIDEDTPTAIKTDVQFNCESIQSSGQKSNFKSANDSVEIHTYSS